MWNLIRPDTFVFKVCWLLLHCLFVLFCYLFYFLFCLVLFGFVVFSLFVSLLLLMTLFRKAALAFENLSLRSKYSPDIQSAVEYHIVLLQFRNEVSNEQPLGVQGIYRGLYYPVLWGLGHKP